MAYTRNQHMLSQWILRNFRSDDTAQDPKGKQRVWCHVVVPTAEGINDIKDLPLAISSVAICKDCFRLIDGETGEIFDIENELSSFERDMANLVRDLVENHNFARLANCDHLDFPVEKLARFAVLQMILNLNNPQSRFTGKDDLFKTLISPILNNIDGHISAALSLPETSPELASEHIYQKLIRIARSSSGEEEKSRAMLIIYALLDLQGKRTPVDTLSYMSTHIFSGIYSIDVFHTGHDIGSTDPRPVFTISPNIFCAMIEENRIYLPLSHNIALRFNQRPGKGFYVNPRIRIFSPAPDSLRCKNHSPVLIYKCSYDYIDQIMSTIDGYNVGFSNIIYSCWQLSDVQNYLKLQDENPDTYYLPEQPEYWVPAEH